MSLSNIALSELDSHKLDNRVKTNAKRIRNFGAAEIGAWARRRKKTAYASWVQLAEAIAMILRAVQISTGTLIYLH